MLNDKRQKTKDELTKEDKNVLKNFWNNEYLPSYIKILKTKSKKTIN